jgi:hypothetical protein
MISKTGSRDSITAALVYAGAMRVLILARHCDTLFHLNTNYKFIEFHPDHEIPERERHTVRSEKEMLT